MKKTVTVFCLFLLCTVSLCASTYDYRYYKTAVNVGRDAVHEVREDFTIDYHQPSHGIYRYIPFRFGNARAKIGRVKCSDICTVDRDSGYLVVRIGSEDKVYTGEKSYALSYNYDCGADKNEGFDVFNFNLLGTDFDCNTDRFDFEIVLPGGNLRREDFDVHITYGSYGSEENLLYRIEEQDGDYVITGSAYGLVPGEGVTAMIVLPDLWYQGTRVEKDYTRLFRLLTLIVPAVLFAVAFIVWTFVGKDDVPIVTARFDAPEDFSPLFTGYLIDETVNDRDMTSMLFYWADKGYIKISEPKKKKYEFTKLRDLPNDCPAVERELFYGFFHGCDANGVIRIGALQNNGFYKAMNSVKAHVPGYFSGDRKLYTSDSRFLSVLFSLLAFIPVALYGLALTASNRFEGGPVFVVPAIFLAVINSSVFSSLMKKWYKRNNHVFATILTLIPSFVGFVILMIISSSFTDRPEQWFYFLFYVVLSSAAVSFMAAVIVRYTDYGKRVKEEVLGFREFIEMVSMPQLVTMINEDPMYYYHVLSYAIALGLEHKWAKKFDSVTVQPPDWYTGISPFNAYFLASFASDVCRNVSVASLPVKDAVRNVGSIAGGGGFSGGGFGGGGSRAW